MNYDKIENIKKLLGPPYNYEVKLINDLFVRQLGDLNRQCDREVNRDVVACLSRNAFFSATATFLGFGDEKESWYCNPSYSSILPWSSFVKKTQDANNDDNDRRSPRNVRHTWLTELLEQPESLLGITLTSSNSHGVLEDVNKRIKAKFEVMVMNDCKFQGAGSFNFGIIFSKICGGSGTSYQMGMSNSLCSLFEQIWKITNILLAVDSKTYKYTTEQKKYYTGESIDYGFPSTTAAVFYLKFLQSYYAHVVNRYNAFGEELNKLIQAKNSGSEHAVNLFKMVVEMMQECDKITKSGATLEDKKNLWETEYNKSIKKIISYEEVYVSAGRPIPPANALVNSTRMSALMMCIDFTVSPSLCFSLFEKMTSDNPQPWEPSPLPPTNLIEFLEVAKKEVILVTSQDDYMTKYVTRDDGGKPLIDICSICRSPLDSVEKFPVLMHKTLAVDSLGKKEAWSHPVHPGCLVKDTKLVNSLWHQCPVCKDVLDIPPQTLNEMAENYPTQQTPASPPVPPAPELPIPLESPPLPPFPQSAAEEGGGKKKRTQRSRRSRQRTLRKKRKYKRYSYKKNKKNK